MGNCTKDSGIRKLESEMELASSSGLMVLNTRVFGRTTKQMEEEE